VSAATVVETTGLRKVYGPTTALDGVDLHVGADSVYGLVGPNGAGKTTLLAILAGLRTPTAGSLRIGTPPERVAVMPDTPQFEPWLAAHEVVDLARRLVAPEVPPSEVDQALGEAGLADVAGRRVGGFSRGMLQRLGLAATIVSRPSLLILDEPCAALDPAGRKDVLDLVTRLGRRGTVLFSSHILSDVQRVCDTVGVLREGRLLSEGPLEALLSNHVSPAFLVRVRSPLDPVLDALRAERWVRAADMLSGNELRVEVRSLQEGERELAGALARAGALVVSFEPEAADLERVFLELTS
jgi:ABC-2 type transport system ATP-binding protein